MIKLFDRPGVANNYAVEQIVSIAKSLVGEWFTADVPAGIAKDLLFQDALCLEINGSIVSFIIITSVDGTLQITLMGTDPVYRGKGYGAKLIEYLFDHARKLGFRQIELFTVPPDKKTAYRSTVGFYERHGFVIEKEYSELWQSGAIKLVKNLNPVRNVINFELARKEDAQTLADIQKLTFEANSLAHTGTIDGPTGYDSVQWQFDKMAEFYYYKIICDGNIVGGMIIVDKGDSVFELRRIFIAPDFQNLKIGQQAMEFMHSTFNTAVKWQIDTPEWATRNHYLYEKMGYRKIGTCDSNKGFLLYEYERITE